VVTILLEEYIDAGVIAFVLILNAVVGFTQEYRAEQSMAALRELARARARVLRDGRERDVDAAELVPGDIILLEAGDRVPADGGCSTSPRWRWTSRCSPASRRRSPRTPRRSPPRRPWPTGSTRSSWAAS
jgi:hypothetical protein